MGIAETSSWEAAAAELDGGDGTRATAEGRGGGPGGGGGGDAELHDPLFVFFFPLLLSFTLCLCGGHLLGV